MADKVWFCFCGKTSISELPLGKFRAPCCGYYVWTTFRSPPLNGVASV